MGGKPPFVKLEWSFAGGAAGARGVVTPTWPGNRGRGLYMSGGGYIPLNTVKTKGFTGIRGRIVQTKSAENDPCRVYNVQNGMYKAARGESIKNPGELAQN